MENIEQIIRKELINLSEESYKKFASSLIPGCSNLIGVRIPNIRKLAKKIASENPLNYLHNAKDIYFEETMLKALIIGNMNEDIEVILQQSEFFIPKITNWSLCDSFCCELKIVKKNKERVWNFLQVYLKSNKTYDIRFSVVLLLNYYIEEKYLEKLFEIFNYIKHDNYYVKMSVAWAVSMCFVKYPDETMKYLKDNNLDRETYNKSLQKIRESLKVDRETKNIIKSMKRD